MPPVLGPLVEAWAVVLACQVAIVCHPDNRVGGVGFRVGLSAN